MADFQTLAQIGFEKVGHFELGEHSSRFVQEKEHAGGVYVFILENSIKYVRITGRTDTKRYAHYNRKPLHQVKAKFKQVLITNELKQGKNIEVYHLPDEEIERLAISLSGNNCHIETEADAKLLERYLISHFCPIWNKN